MDVAFRGDHNVVGDPLDRGIHVRGVPGSKLRLAAWPDIGQPEPTNRLVGNEWVVDRWFTGKSATSHGAGFCGVVPGVNDRLAVTGGAPTEPGCTA